MKKILLFSSICKPQKILEISLSSYLNLDAEGFELDILFYDDNNEKASSNFINNLANEYPSVSLMQKKDISLSEYKHHNWNPSKIDRVITIKNEAILYSLKNGYDALFLVDADLVLHPKTLVHLFSLKLDFVFEVFWTLFFRESIHKPNAWDKHSWSYLGPETLFKLSQKGTYEVGGGGACTLLSNKIMEEGVNFNRLKSLPYQGEDRHICTHAQAKGYPIMVDTHFPAYHIFLDEQVEEAKEWYQNGADPAFFNNWLNKEWSTLVKNFFIKPKISLLMKLKRFQYEVRISFSKIFLNA